MSQHFVQLRTTAITEKIGADRPTFEASVARGTFSSAKRFQVFCSAQSMLFMRVGDPAQGGEDNATGVVVAGALLGGMMGAVVGGMIADNLKATSVGGLTHNYSLYTDDQIVEMARHRKGSFLSEYADITSASIEGPSFSDRMFSSTKLVGNITIRDKTLGKLVLEIKNTQAMLTAIQALKTRLGDRVKVNLEWNEEKHAFDAV